MSQSNSRNNSCSSYETSKANRGRIFSSYDDLSSAAADGYIAVAPPLQTIKCSAMNYSWTLSDAVEKTHSSTPKLPIVSFNHISREVLNLKKSREFYLDILGFEEIPRPPFDSDGIWLAGYGLNLHLIVTKVPQERKRVKLARIQHFSSSLPTVDHIAFITHNLDVIRETLDRNNVYYKHEKLESSEIEQVFFFDPDGNVIEISNCVPERGRITCKQAEEMLQVIHITKATGTTPGSDEEDEGDVGEAGGIGLDCDCESIEEEGEDNNNTRDRLVSSSSSIVSHPRPTQESHSLQIMSMTDGGYNTDDNHSILSNDSSLPQQRR